jgi:hypothetical protein
VGNGNPIDLLGADCLSTFCNYPAFTRPLVGEQWIKGAPGAPLVNYDWRSPGADGCITGGAPNTLNTAFAHYIIDSDDLYAVAVLSATAAAVDFVNLDNLSTGVGPNGNDVTLVPLNGNAPQLTEVTVLSDACAEGTVLPAACGVNAFSDLTGCDPYSVIDVNLLTLLNDGVPETCDPNTGCTLSCIKRDKDLCWDGNTLVIGTSLPGSSICQGGGFAGFPCTPGDLGEPCLSLGGVCPDAPPTITAMGPPIIGDCTEIGGPIVSDSVARQALDRSRGLTTFRWDATQFAVSHFNIIDVTRLDRQVNANVIARRGDNDGSVTTYEFVAAGRDVRGGRRFELEMVRTDGETLRFAFE